MADEESVKMATLKKAYAEIILNSSKEAAARIMAADRRTLCFQKDLFALKEDALRMLVHLKQVLDFKTAEAEVRSKNQTKKIEELEAQLSEAEGITVDLREELRLTQDKLEKMKCSQKQHLRRHISDDHDQQPPFRNELTAKTADGICRTFQYPSTENASTTKYQAEMAQQMQYPRRDQLIVSAQEQPSTLVQPSILSDCNASSTTVDEKCSIQRYSPSSSESNEKGEKVTSNGSEAISLEPESGYGQALRDGFRRTRKNVKYQEAIAALCRSSRGRCAKSCQPPSFHKCGNYAGNQNGASTEVHDRNGMHSTQGSSYICSSYGMNDNIAPEKSNGSRDDSIFGETEGNAAEKYCNLICDIDPHKCDAALVGCNLLEVQIPKESEGGISNQSDNDKVLKFTFQRKRKREVLTKLDNNITPEVNNIMSKALLEQGDGAKLQKSIFKDEQSKDSQQLLQVARQLISLSGNGRT